jgi:hypothetical protein
MEHTHFCEANNHSASQICQNVHYCVYNIPPYLPILIQINPIYIFPHFALKIRFNIILDLCLSLLSYLSPIDFAAKILYAFLSPPLVMYALTKFGIIIHADYVWRHFCMLEVRPRCMRILSFFSEAYSHLQLEAETLVNDVSLLS